MTQSSALEVSDLSFQYPPQPDEPSWSLRVAGLELARGESVLLTAPSGRGKSTLLNIIAGLMEPDAGRVLVDGQDVHALRGAARDRFRGQRIGMIFQTFNLLLGFSALENVMAALMFSRIPAGEHKDRAAALLKELNITRPMALVEQLSVGQQQRVAVARAVACEPVLVLADEPTASLDPETGAAAIELIQRLCVQKNAALLCVSHDPSMTRRFTRVERLETLAAAEASR